MDVQQYTEGGITYRVGQRVRTTDPHRMGEETEHGRLHRIELLDGLDGDEAVCWILWDGTSAPDPHGIHDFTTV